jgi:hypothetical protein
MPPAQAFPPRNLARMTGEQLLMQSTQHLSRHQSSVADAPFDIDDDDDDDGGGGSSDGDGDGCGASGACTPLARDGLWGSDQQIIAKPELHHFQVQSNARHGSSAPLLPQLAQRLCWVAHHSARAMGH